MTGLPGPTMRALLLTGPRHWQVAEVPVPVTEPGHCLVRVAYVGLCDVDDAGLALARELGAEVVLRPEEADDDGYGAVIEASGAESAIALAPRLVAPGGRLAFLGVPHGPVPAFPSAQLVMKNLEVHGLLSGIEQWDGLLRLVVDGHVDLGALIDRVLPLASAGEALTALAGGRRSRPKVLLEIGGRSGSADLTERAA